MDTATQSGRRRPGRPAVRAYRQGVRARQADANTGRIVAACVALVTSVRRLADITLDDIARESGVTVRTVLRRFGSRDGAFEAAFSRLELEIRSLRQPTPPGDVGAAIASLLNQYEQLGDWNIRALEAEDQLPLVHRELEVARREHRKWLAAIFGPRLANLSPREKERRIVALYAATDIYVWKLLRRDLKVDRGAAEEVIGSLVRGVLADAAAGPRSPTRRGRHAG